MIHHPKQSSPVILTATAVCGDSDPGDNDITVRVVCDCNDHVSCTPVTKGDYQYTIGGPIEDTEIEIPDGNDTVVAVGQTIEVSATQGQDMDCKIIGEVVPREEVYDRVGPRWSVRRWNIHTRHQIHQFYRLRHCNKCKVTANITGNFGPAMAGVIKSVHRHFVKYCICVITNQIFFKALSGKSLEGENSLEEPKKIYPVEKSVSVNSPSFSYEFQPYSLNILRVPVE